MIIDNQEKIWDKIAPEWHEFKKLPSLEATKFLNKSHGKILDFGSGSGRNLLKLKKSSKREIYLADFSGEMLRLAEKRAKELGIKIKTKKTNLKKTDFKDNFFDAAICTAVIHCIETDGKRKASIKELYRILKPGAEAEIEVWKKNSPRFKNSPKEKFIAWNDKGMRYYYLYEEKEIYDLFKKIGFKIIKKIADINNIIFIAQKP